VKTEVLPAADPEAISRAAEVLRRGGLVAFPTDTVYGVGAPVFAAEAVSRLYTLKGRPLEKAIAVLVSGPSDVAGLAASLPPEAERLAAAFWPGALTLVVPKRDQVPEEVSPHGTVGVRMPDHPVSLALLKATGPLATTSANWSGEPSSVTAEQVLAALDGRIDLVLDGGRTPGSLSSTVLDCTASPPRILRQGPISEAQIRQVLTGGQARVV
jgi:L-threonylcarbamoyladenylate synthase